jgi:hypothetical protein
MTLVPFQLVSPNVGGLPRSNFPVLEAQLDRPRWLERGLPARNDRFQQNRPDE